MLPVVELDAKATMRAYMDGWINAFYIPQRPSQQHFADRRHHYFAPVPPTALPGVLDVIFCGTGADVGCVCELLPRTRPGVENWSS